MTNPEDLRTQAQQLLERATELETQLTHDDVQQMYAEQRYADIVQARADGRLSTYLNTPTEGENA